MLASTVIYTGDRRFFWKSATSSPPELKEIETWQTTHFEDIDEIDA